MSENPFSVEMQRIGMTLWNPTNEKLEMQYAGISIGLEPGQEWACHMKCAMHLLNAFGQRGLTSLPYGCNKDKIGKEAIQRNLDFKKKQVVEFNQRNEARFNMKLGYLVPDEKVKEYARELDLTLMEPYTVRDEERAGISDAKKENEALRAKVEAQEKEMAEIKELMKQYLSARPPEPPDTDPPKSDLRVRKNGKWVKE